MASVIRAGIVRLQCPGLPNNLLKITALPAVTPSCCISSKSMRGGPRVPLGKPWPYKEKKYGVFQAMLDKTSHRMDENSKIICVEGPVAAGKSKLAKELAAELDMLYVPPANMDYFFINPYGYDLRKLDDKLPEMCRSFDEKNFCQNPKHLLAAQFQIRMYMIRFSQYIDSLAHLLSTGQGVVLDRSVYSDFVFAESMFKNGYISKGAHSVYHEIRQNTINELLKPHLVIYLDCPVDVVKKRIKARNLDYEVQSKLFNDSYLSDMEVFYKQHFLKDISIHSEILIYDWTAEGETEVVVEDIERIDFNVFEEYFFNKKMKDWRFPLEWDWCEARIKYCNDKHTLMSYFNVPRFDVPELLREASEGKIWREVMESAPGMKYTKGYNIDMGDKDVLTKTRVPFRENTYY